MRVLFQLTPFLQCAPGAEGERELSGVSQENSSPILLRITPQRPHLRVPSHWGEAFSRNRGGGPGAGAHSVHSTALRELRARVRTARRRGLGAPGRSGCLSALCPHPQALRESTLRNRVGRVAEPGSEPPGCVWFQNQAP